jgi:hypothetical protein
MRPALLLLTLAVLSAAGPVPALAPVAGATGAAAPGPAPLFAEAFEDGELLRRGWYDGSSFVISATRPRGGRGCLEYAWRAAGTTPTGSSGARRLFAPAEQVYLRFYLRLSPGWAWTNRPYHPHLMHFMTTENGRFHGPAASRLTLYVEPVGGRLRLAAQDIQNKDAPRGLTQGPLRGGYNGRMYDSKDVLFTDDSWHLVEALFRLNTVDAATGKANADGLVRGWFDGRLVVDHSNVILRSADFPGMRFNQFLMLPYFGPGLLPQAQTLWVDELSVSTDRR